jgi:hypothetical protein
MVLYYVLVIGCGLILLFILAFIREVNHVPREWLRERVHVVIEREHDDTFGWLKPGDEIWWYRSPPESWQRLTGRSGSALVRKGKVIRSHLVLMN